MPRIVHIMCSGIKWKADCIVSHVPQTDRAGPRAFELRKQRNTWKPRRKANPRWRAACIIGNSKGISANRCHKIENLEELCESHGKPVDWTSSFRSVRRDAGVRPCRHRVHGKMGGAASRAAKVFALEWPRFWIVRGTHAAVLCEGSPHLLLLPKGISTPPRQNDGLRPSFQGLVLRHQSIRPHIKSICGGCWYS